MRAKQLGTVMVIVTILLLGARSNSFSQEIAVKSNLPYLATSTPNMAIELGVSEKFTLDLSYGINPFVFKENKKWKHWLAQTELRYWLHERFSGHFLGLHVGMSEYNLSKIKIPTVTDSQYFRYEGSAFMGGLSYGYSWALGEKWKLEVTMGLGVMAIDYKKFECPECGKQLEEENKVFIAPTKAAINIIYMLK